jgi:small subunit ribosomal protein S18
LLRKKNDKKGRSKGTRKGPGRKKVCKFCADSVEKVDYKDVQRLKFYTTERGKILPARISGVCAKHQRQLTTAVKRAREAALMPYIAERS